jgi:hypothetical protein
MDSQNPLLGGQVVGKLQKGAYSSRGPCRAWQMVFLVCPLYLALPGGFSHTTAKLLPLGSGHRLLSFRSFNRTVEARQVWI